MPHFLVLPTFGDFVAWVLSAPMFVHIVLAIVFAGAGRVLVGGGWMSRGIVYPIVAAYAALVGFGATWWALVFGGAAAATLWLGFTRWEDPLCMAARYAVLPAVAAFAYVYAAGSVAVLLWPIACAIVGALYGTIQERFADGAIDSSRYAEALAGGVVIGWVAPLSLLAALAPPGWPFI